MKRFELILVIISVVAVLLRLLEIPYSSLLVILSLSILAILYFYLGFALLNGIGVRELFKKDSYKNLTALRIIGAIVASLFMSVAVLGVLFSLQGWPFAELYNISAVIGLAISLVVAVIKLNTSRAAFYKGIILRCLLFGGASALFYFLNV